MDQFKQILVAVDLCQGDRIVYHELPPPSLAAVRRAFWLAKRNQARLTFFYTLDVTAAAERMIAEAAREATPLDEATKLLQGLVEQAAEQGIEADSMVCFGKSWLEIIRQVLRGGHDLVLAGTRHLGSVEGLLLGSTGVKLLRKCPCPVWITQPDMEKPIRSVLVAHCLRTVGDQAMDLGCSLASLQNSRLHVLHALEIPESVGILPSEVSPEQMAQYEANANAHIRGQLEQHQFADEPHVHIIAEPADVAILETIQQHDIEVVVMGTIARGGVAGFITGNTAERLLPQIPCSILAVKPPDFVSPVHV